MEDRVGGIVDLVTHTRKGHVTGQAISYSRVTSGLTSMMMETRPREDSYREIRNPSQTLGTKKGPPHNQSSSSISFLNINEEFCSAYVGRNNSYKRPSLRDLITATSPRPPRYEGPAQVLHLHNMYVFLCVLDARRFRCGASTMAEMCLRR